MLFKTVWLTALSFIIKTVLMPFFGVVLFTWALTASNGFGPLFSIPNNITNGWTIGYAFCTTITASISGNATFAINMSGESAGTICRPCDFS